MGHVNTSHTPTHQKTILAWEPTATCVTPRSRTAAGNARLGGGAVSSLGIGWQWEYALTEAMRGSASEAQHPGAASLMGIIGEVW